MRPGAFEPIIAVVDEDPKPAVPVAICGDPVVGRALALLLRASSYEGRLLPLDDSGDPGSLRDAQVVVLAPTPGLSPGRREALITTLKERAAAVGIPVLELTAFSEGAWAKPTPGTVPWPCSTEALRRRIVEALPATDARQEGKRARTREWRNLGGRSGRP